MTAPPADMATEKDGARGKGGAFAPLRERTFRNIWTASLLSNFGQLILGVGAAWEMTRLSNSPSMVALVQTAMMVPLMFVALPAGAVADMFDRRRIAMTGLGFSALSGAVLTALAFLDLTSPWMLLAFCVLIGSGVALYSPSWQASIGEQVSEEHLPAAVALGTISYNVARSFGPALGGLIVLALGAKAAFAINAAFYLPLLMAFALWKRQHVPSRLPPERMDRAILSGARYVFHATPIRTVLIRAFLFGIASASIVALGPLIAKQRLGGDAATYGIMLGASGIGAVLGALLVGEVRERISTELATRLCTVATALAVLAVAFSTSLAVTCVAMFVTGGCNILAIALMNVSVQLSAPRWVIARAISLYSSALTAGIGVGAWIWGVVASHSDLTFALVASGICVLLTLAVAWGLPLAQDQELDTSLVDIGHEPEVALGLTMRSGPVVIEMEYEVEPDNARAFYGLMLQMQLVRKRNGGFDWSIARDMADPAIWTEHYHCPTWGDYLRMRSRYTQADIDLQKQVDEICRPGAPRRIRRRLERPFGSVRWKAESPDLYKGPVGFISP